LNIRASFIAEFGFIFLLKVIITLLYNSGKAWETISQFYPATAFFSASFFRCPYFLSIPSLFKQ